jgi:hypothetical protein
MFLLFLIIYNRTLFPFQMYPIPVYGLFNVAVATMSVSG